MRLGDCGPTSATAGAFSQTTAASGGGLQKTVVDCFCSRAWCSGLGAGGGVRRMTTRPGSAGGSSAPIHCIRPLRAVAGSLRLALTLWATGASTSLNDPLLRASGRPLGTGETARSGEQALTGETALVGETALLGDTALRGERPNERGAGPLTGPSRGVALPAAPSLPPTTEPGITEMASKELPEARLVPGTASSGGEVTPEATLNEKPLTFLGPGLTERPGERHRLGDISLGAQAPFPGGTARGGPRSKEVCGPDCERGNGEAKDWAGERGSGVANDRDGDLGIRKLCGVTALRALSASGKVKLMPREATRG